MTRRKVVIESESVIEPHQAGGQKEKGQLRAVRTASARLPLMKNWLCSVSSVPLLPSFPGSFKSAADFVISFLPLYCIYSTEICCCDICVSDISFLWLNKQERSRTNV